MNTIDIEFEWDRSIGLGSMFGDSQSVSQTDTHTFFLKQFFGIWEWCRIKIHKKSKSNFLMIAILPSLLMLLESKIPEKLEFAIKAYVTVFHQNAKHVKYCTVITRVTQKVFRYTSIKWYNWNLTITFSHSTLPEHLCNVATSWTTIRSTGVSYCHPVHRSPLGMLQPHLQVLKTASHAVGPSP